MDDGPNLSDLFWLDLVIGVAVLGPLVVMTWYPVGPMPPGAAGLTWRLVPVRFG